MASSHASTARTALAIVAATYGSNYACVKLLDEWVGSPAVAACLRFSVAFAAMAPALAYLASQDRRYVSWPFARDGLLVGSCFFAGYAVQAMALETSTASLQAFLLSLSVVVCPLLERFGDGKRQPLRVWLAAGLSTLGVLCLELDGASDAVAGGMSSGDLLGLLQPVFFGLGFWQCEHAMARHQQPASTASESRDVSLATPIALTAWQLAAVAALSLLWTCASDGGAAGATGDGLSALVACVSQIADDPASQPALLATVAWTGLGTTAGCSLVEAAALGELTSSEATVVFSTEPLWGAAFASAMLHESMGPQCQLGGALMVIACIVSGVEIAPGAVAGAAARTLGEARRGVDWLVESCGLALGVPL